MAKDLILTIIALTLVELACSTCTACPALGSRLI
jgi:hypothetical protein